MDDIKALIFKLNAVIDGAGCTAGEKDNARRLRDNLLRKAGLTLEDINPPAEMKTYWIRYENSFEKRLASQILARIRDNQVTSWHSRRYPHHIGMEMTADEYEAVKVKYAALRKALAEEMELCYSAFVQANSLGISPRDQDGVKDKDRRPTAAEIKELDRLFTLAGLMGKTKIPETRKSRLIPGPDPDLSKLEGVSNV